MPLAELKKTNKLPLAGLRKIIPDLDLGGISFETFQTTPQTTEGGGISPTLPIEIAQGIARSGGSVGLTLTSQEELKIDPTSSKLQQTVQKIIFGDEPVKSLATRIAEGELKAKELGLGKASLPVSFLAVGAMTALDFTGAGGEKNLIKTLVKETDEKVITSLLKKVGVSDDLIPSYSSAFAKATKAEEVQKGLDSLNEIIKTTKKAEPVTSKDLDSLAQEAISVVESGGTINKFDEFSNVIIRRVPENQIRNKGTGDYKLKKDGGIEILVSEKLNDIESKKVAIHELIESNFAKKRGISFEDINKFDEENINVPQPGSLKNAPYFEEHKLGNEAEKLFTDFYNQEVKGVKEIAPIKEPQLTTKVSGGIADEAIKFAKENPDSSLVAKEFRNPRTKELESPPRLFKRIGESIRNGEIDISELPKLTKEYNLTAQETAQLFEDAATFSGRTLQALSRVEKELRKLLPDIQLPKREPTIWEHFKSGYLAIDNFRRGLLVTQLATAARNAISQTGRYTLGTITDGMNGVVSKITGKGEGFTPFLEDIAAVLRKTKKGNVEKLQQVLRENPIENARLYNTPVGDVALTGKITDTLNAFNRGQEYFFRNLILDAKLHSAAKTKGMAIEKLGIDDVSKAVDEALEWTYSKNPIRGSFGSAIMTAYRAMPLLTLINPFPRFMTNAVKFLFDYSPAGIMSLFSSKTRAAIAAGDYNAISKAIIGTSMLGAALTIRANDNLAGEKWYEIKVGDKTIDTRPFAPFSTYLLFGELMFNGGKNLSGADWAQAAIGINRVAGTGLALIDLISEKVDYKNAKGVLNTFISAYIGGFTVPFVTIKDIVGNFRLEERTVKETREIPIIGGAIGNIPALNEILPAKYSMFQDKPLEREASLLRQLTGITLKTKSFIEKELDRIGKNIGDLIPKTGNLEANRIISKQTGVILDKFNNKFELSETYQVMSDDEKLELLKELISEAKKEAKGETASDLAGVVYNEIKKSSSEERKKVIKNLNNKGLMTENIMDYLLPMLEAQPLAK